MMAVNAEHSMRLKKQDGKWRITFHYFPGSRRKFTGSGTGILPSAGEMLRELEEEFSDPGGDIGEAPAPEGALAYDGGLAAEYAVRFTEAPNDAFYHIGDWMGNCANFTSQCIWYGFRGADGQSDSMTSAWYAGTGGGSPAWENVRSFWSFAVEGGALSGRVPESAAGLKQGDLIQTSPVRLGLPDSGDEDDEDDEERQFNHSLVVVDEETLLLGQNSPGCFVYYSDLVNVETRIFRPGYIWRR